MFLQSQNDENQSENGSKNSKIRLRARPPAEPQKKMLQTKKLKSKSWKTRGFFTFRLPILDGRVQEQVSSVLFFTVFFEGERHDLSKTGGFGRKMPPPGKPVTFCECHPEDHAPAPSVRADLRTTRFSSHHLIPWYQSCQTPFEYLQSSCDGSYPKKTSEKRTRPELSGMLYILLHRPLCTSSTVLLVVNFCESWWYVYAFKPRIMR